MTAREALHALVEELPEAQLTPATRLLKNLRAPQHPFARALDEAPWDDEPLTDADLLALEEAEDDEKAGRIFSHEEVLRRLQASR